MTLKNGNQNWIWRKKRSLIESFSQLSVDIYNLARTNGITNTTELGISWNTAPQPYPPVTNDPDNC